MTFRAARSIDEVYEAVADADLVVTADGPLSLALDNRIQTPRLGRLAATPRSHAIGEMVPEDNRDLFVQFIETTDLPWKQAVRALDLCIACWTLSGELDRILSFPEFDRPAIRDAVTFLDETKSSYLAVANGTLPDDLNVQVVDDEQLTKLDRSYLPDEYGTVSSLRNEPSPLPPVHVYPSATAIIDAVLDAITPENANDVGVVVPSGSRYAALLEAGLDARNIPRQGGAGFADHPDVRAFCRLVESTFAGSSQRVSDVRPVLAAVDVSVPRGLDDRRVDSVDSGRLGGYIEFRNATVAGSFRDVINGFEELTGRYPTTLHDELATLGLLDVDVTRDKFASFRYYLETFDVPGEGGDTDGVLLTDATATAYVDRSTVFYLGLGPEWAQSPPDYPWVDETEFLERDLRRFERLLGNGAERYFLVQDSHAGDEVQPCVYMRKLVDEPFKSFGDFEHVRHDGVSNTGQSRPFEAPDTPRTSPDPEETLSQSHLNTLVNSPRDAYFDRLVETPTSLPMARGQVLHEAAEIHVADPSVIPERREEVLDAMCELLDPYLDDARRPTQRTKLEVALDAVVETLNAAPPEPATYATYEIRERENDLANELGVEADSELTERWFESPSLGVRGFIDLLANPTTVVDYKTGTKKDAGDHLSAASLDPVAERPDFQSLVYLLKHREERPGERISLRFVYLMDSEHVDAAVAGTPPTPEERVTTVTYVPRTFSEFVAGRDTFDSVTDYADSNPRVKTLSKLGYEPYREFFESHELPREGEDSEQRARVTEAFIEYTKERVGDYAYVENGCKSVIDDLSDTPEGYVLKSDLDALEAFVDDRLDELDEYRRSRFPVAFREDGPTWDRVNHRDLILTDR